MRSVEIFRGREIDDEKIAKLREIAEKRYDHNIYTSSYCGIETIQGLAHIHGVKVDNEILVLGEDWFLSYVVYEQEIIFLELIARDIKDCKFNQVVEIMNTFNRIFLQHKEKQFIASMRHDSSYQLYSKMLQRGYFEEIVDNLDIDLCNGFAPERLKFLEEDYHGLENFLQSSEAMHHPEYLKYILHDLRFFVTDKVASKAAVLQKKIIED